MKEVLRSFFYIIILVVIIIINEHSSIANDAHEIIRDAQDA